MHTYLIGLYQVVQSRDVYSFISNQIVATCHQVIKKTINISLKMAMMETTISPSTSSTSTRIFYLKNNPLKLETQRLLKSYIAFILPLVIIMSLIYTYFKSPQYTMLVSIIGILVIVLLFVVSERIFQKADYHITINPYCLIVFKNNHAIHYIPLKNLTTTTSFWGNSNAFHPAIILKNKHHPTLSIGTHHCTEKRCQSKDIMDYTDYVLTDKIDWKQFIKIVEQHSNNNQKINKTI